MFLLLLPRRKERGADGQKAEMDEGRKLAVEASRDQRCRIYTILKKVKLKDLR